MLSRTTRLWICSLILAVLGQLGWAAAMPLASEAPGQATATHADMARSAHPGHEHCDPTPSSGEQALPFGHACCPLIGLEPSAVLGLTLAEPRVYGRAITPAPHSEVVDAIFKPPKTPL